MPTGIYPHKPRSEECKEKIRNTMRGRKYSEERKRNIGQACMGRLSHRKGKTLYEEYGKERASIIRKRLSNAHIGFIMGEKNPNWKGGIVPLAEQIRKCFKYRQWRSDIFTGDNFVCQKCGAKSGDGKAVYLEADHYPKRFSDIVAEYKIKTLEEALNCEELWNVNNGRTLCRKCHNKTKTYGRK